MAIFPPKIPAAAAEVLKDAGNYRHIGGIGAPVLMGGGAGGAVQVSVKELIEDNAFRSNILAGRLRLSVFDLAKSLGGFGTTMGKDKVFVHFVRDDELVVFSDDVGLYPSDDLITKIRLCIK